LPKIKPFDPLIVLDWLRYCPYCLEKLVTSDQELAVRRNATRAQAGQAALPRRVATSRTTTAPGESRSTAESSTTRTSRSSTPVPVSGGASSRHHGRRKGGDFAPWILKFDVFLLTSRWKNTFS